ncbi:hypothetical protein FF38_09743, partial [Lucilia cuprina]
QSSLVALRTLLSESIISQTNFTEDYTNLLLIIPEIGDDSVLWSRRRESLITEITYCQASSGMDKETTILHILTENGLKIKFGNQFWDYGFEYLGASATSSWVCFDEFNRLERKVLSGIAPILSVNVRKTAIFVTMNPGYKEMHCEYTNENDTLTLSPHGQRRAALFMDEINLPEPNDTGVSPVLQLIRGFILQGGFYNSQGTFVKLERIQFVGACNPPPLRRELPPRFLKNWLIISVNYPNEDSLRTIYSSYLSAFGAQSILEPMLAVYKRLQEIMPSEIWTPRELTRWTRSIFVAYDSTNEGQRSPELLAKLFVHEGERVLGDRMLGSDIKHLLEGFSTAISTNVQFGPEVWTGLITQKPKFVSFDQLSRFLQARLAVFTEEAAFGEDKYLVAHNDFLVHVTRVDRILRQPQGHVLLKGPPSVGKSTVVKFASWLSGLDTMFITSNNKYTDQDFSRDLRTAVLKSLRRTTAIVMADDLLDRPEFVERTNALLANGESPNLFSNTEQLQELEEASKRAGFSGTDLNFWVRSKVVDNLHAVILSSNETSA